MSVVPSTTQEKGTDGLVPPVKDNTGSPTLDTLNSYFLQFWKPHHAAKALNYLERLETRRSVQRMTKTRSAVPWVPPSDWIEFLAAPKTTKLSEMTDSPDLRCLRFILYILGCPSNGRRPYDEFLKAKTIKQKRAWLYKYHGPKFKPPANYVEPIPPIRMARLKTCFPSKFITIGSQTFLDSRLVVKDEAQQIYYAEQH